MEYTITTYPSEAEILALVSVADMKESLRISHSVEDNFIKTCILAAYDWLGGGAAWLNRPILTTGYTAYIAAFASAINFPRPPLIGVSALKYYSGGVLETVPPSVYGFASRGPWGVGSINLKADQVWPDLVDAGAYSVEVTFTAGFGDAATVKARHPVLVRALMLLAGDYYRNREDTFVDIRMVEINRKTVNDVERTAGRYKIYNRIV